MQTALETRDAARATVAALHQQETQMHRLQEQYDEVSGLHMARGTLPRERPQPVDKNALTSCLVGIHPYEFINLGYAEY